MTSVWIAKQNPRISENLDWSVVDERGRTIASCLSKQEAKEIAALHSRKIERIEAVYLMPLVNQSLQLICDVDYNERAITILSIRRGRISMVNKWWRVKLVGIVLFLEVCYASDAWSKIIVSFRVSNPQQLSDFAKNESEEDAT